MTGRIALGAEIRRSARASDAASARPEREAGFAADAEPEHRPREQRFEYDFAETPVHAAPPARPDAGPATTRDAAPAIVSEAIRAPGEPLEPNLIATLRQTHDFARAGTASETAREPAAGNAREPVVLGHLDDDSERAADAAAQPSSTPDTSAANLAGARIHTGATAARAAAAVDAQAFTVGNDIVFGAGAFAPDSPRGRFLLAHELAHVAQNERGAPAFVVRRRSVFESAAIFLGLSEGDFSETELLDYLKTIGKADAIEDHYDSDNKARAIVRKWLASDPKFRLNARQMTLLIREMDTGYVGSEDQTGIFDLLSHAANGELRTIFGSGGVSPKQLESDFSGDRRKRLEVFYDTRFKGGKAALYAGTVDPVAGTAAATPKFAWDFAAFEERVANPAYTEDELAAELTALPDAQRDAALKDVGKRRDALARTLVELIDQHNAEPDPVKQKALEGTLLAVREKRRRYDAILPPAFRDIALAETPATLLAKTHAPTAAEKGEIARALKPDLPTGPGGVALAFSESIPGEKKYGEKIDEYMPAMIKKYYDDNVVGKGPAEHADPAKTHKLDEFDSIAAVARDETNSVFGPYLTGTHPALRADRPPPVGRGQIHDLFADTQAQLAAMGPAAKRAMAKTLVLYFFQNDGEIGAINRKHNADPRFRGDGTPLNPEARIEDGIADRWVASPAHVKALNEIDRNWGASADPKSHEINLQIFKGDTPENDRRALWDMLQTLIHEYIHTLANAKYVNFAENFGPGQQNTTLIEGVDSLLTEIVWSQTKAKTADPGLRAKVEGAAYSGQPFDATVIPPIYAIRYPSYAQAVKLVNVVGIRNLYAAYFMGKVELIKPA